MGRPSSSQPKHCVLDVEPVKHTSLQQTRSKGGVRQCDSIPPSAPPAIDEPTPHRHPSPSPLITSLSSEKYFDAYEEFPPLSSPIVTEDDYEGKDEDDSEDIFHDALESLGRPILANVHQVVPSPQYDGAAKGRAGVQPRNRPLASTPAASPSTPAPSFESLKFGFPSNAERGSAKPAATPTGRPAVTPAAAQARNAVPWYSFPLPRPPVKKALVVGINYKDLSEDKRLYYAVRDAKLWHKTLLGRGVSDENIRTITDELPEGEAPTCEVLVEQIRWLVQGAKAGDSLFFIFSGHAVPTQFGPSIVTADHRKLFRPVLERELVMPVPAGVDLQVVFDCCHSAGMISLQYCVGRMAKEAPSSDSPTEVPMDCSSDFEPSEPLAPIPEATPVRSSSPYPNAPQHGSLYGIPAADTAIPRQPPVPPAVLNQDTFSPPPTRHSHVRGGTVVAAQPLTGTANAAPAAGNPLVAAASYMASFMGIGSAPAASTAPAPVQTPASSESSPAAARLPTSSGPRRACQGVVEGTRIPDYFAERTEGYVRTAGKVMVWAGTGERQKAFETYGRARHGVVTKALCAALEQVGTRRDMWSYLVQEIEAENDKRWKRDATKAISEQPIRSTRIQHAELWVSQGHSFGPLRSAAPALDQPIL